MPQEDLIDLLARTPLIGLLGRDAMRLLAVSAETRRLRAGQPLFRLGDRSDGGYVVLSGTIVIGQEPDALVAEPGSLIDRLALFVRTQRGIDATARTDSTVLRLSQTLMRRVLEEFPDSALSLRDALSTDIETLAGGLARVRERLLAIDGR